MADLRTTTAPEVEARSISVPLGGAELRAERRGANPTLVFVHGFGGDLESWDPIWTRLGDLPAIRYDQRGYGRSSALTGQPYSHVEDLLALLDAAGIERADLVGISAGGAIATGFALDHPGRVRRLALISPGLMGWAWSDEWRALWRQITIAARAGEMAKARELWWQHPFFRTTREGPAAQELHESIERFAGAQWIADPQRPVLPDLDRLPQLQAPTLLLSGGLDVADFRLIANLIEGAAPHVERVDFPAHGHMLCLEAPDEVALRLRAFLTA